MGEATLWDRIKGFIGHVGWITFLWSINMTEDQYHIERYWEEKAYREEHGMSL